MNTRVLTLATVVLLATAVPFGQQPLSPQAERAALGELVALLSLPNVATSQADIHRNAQYLKQAFERRGFQMEVVETSHSPVVLGELRAPGSTRSLTFYARSSSDDKGAIAALLAALDQVRASGVGMRSTIRVILEGDEEAGSPVLEQVVMARARPEDPASHSRGTAGLQGNRGTAGLQAGGDLIIMMDGPRHASGRPTFFFGARGIVSAEIAVFGAKHDLHSGNYGNWAPNPALDLARLLASMKDDDGKVTIAGFYDDVVPLTAEEKRAIAEIPDVERDEMRAFGFARSEPGGQLSSLAGPRLEERHNLPAFNVSGLGSGTVAGQGRTIIPSVAVARIDMRLRQQPARSEREPAVRGVLRWDCSDRRDPDDAMIHRSPEPVS